MGRKRQSFGEILRERRVAKGYSLRKFAELLGVSPTYLSQVEQDKVEAPPTTERVQRMAELLEVNPDEFIALAGRVPGDLPEIIQKQPMQMPELLREASGLTADQLRKLTEQARKFKDKDGKP
jgi:HTH-type transcriptional regulator, competence development regulator